MPSQSSRRLRLATAAVLGLSVVGTLPLAATAAPLPTGYTAVVLLTPEDTLNNGADGTNSTIRLEAGAPGTVASVRFEYEVVTPGLGDTVSDPVVIQTVSRNDDGAFAVEWAGPPTPTFPIPGTTYNVRAVGLTGGGAVSGSDVVSDLTVTANPGVNLDNASALGYFVVPQTGATKDHALLSVTGTRGPREADGNSFFDRTVTIGAFTATGSRAGGAIATPLTDSAAGSFAVELDLGVDGVDQTPGVVDQVALWADLVREDAATRRDTDVEAYTLYRQAIATVTATPDRGNVAPGESANVTVAVADDRGKPVVGAQVVRQTTGTPAQAPVILGVTGPTGTFTTSQTGGTTAFYYANADDVVAFDTTKGDKRSADLAITNVQTTPTSLVATSADGPAFDLDEVDNVPSAGTGNDADATDVTVQVKDQRGIDSAAGASQDLEYFWNVTPFSGGVATRFPAVGSSTGTPEGGGKFSVVVPAGGSGTYELFAGLTQDPITTNGAIASSKVLTVKAGQAAITWDRTSPQEAPAGATSNVTGRLALPDGTGLPGRDLALTFQRDTNTADEDPTPDAGFTSGGGTTLSTTVTTTSSGTFSVSVTDPADSPQQQELGDNIDAASATNAFGNAAATRNDQVVNFVQDGTVTAVTLTESRESAILRPGEFTLYTVKVANRLGGGIAGQDVTLTTDKGYFSRDDGSALTTSPTPAPSPAAGADAGTFRNDTRSVTLETGPDGTATVFLAMGRDTGFDDDGQVVSRVTAALGALSARDDHAWTSANPINGGAVELVVSDQAQDSAILPKAQTSDEVDVDVLVTDQFGNAVGGENISLTDDSAGSIEESDGTADDGTIVSDFATEGDATLTSATGSPQKVTASWTTERLTYTGASTTTTPGTETLTDDYTVEWYEVDLAASDITFTPNGAGPREVGSGVTLTYEALDQLGQPISDLFIAFTRSGPGAGSDTTGSSNALTGADGTAAYTFVGSVPGRADVTATARLGSASGEVLSAASRTASVTFEEEQVDPVKPRLETTKRIKGNKLVIKVAVTASTQDPVQGTLVLTENGKRLLTRELNADGERKLVVRGLKKGFHSVRLTFQGNDLVRERSKTFTFTIR
jgi:protocatechuate 3,4-dioxygenase beta subunit